MPKGDATRTPKGRAPHRRDETAHLAVLHAADDLLVERGFAGVTIEGIAARAGVAKQTIYRWWSSKVEILLDTLIEDAGRQLTVPQTGSTVEATRRYLRGLSRFLTREPAGQVMLALIGEAQHDPAVAATLAERFLTPHRAQERGLLAPAVARGELPAGTDVDALLDALTGPIIWRALTGARISRAFIDELIAGALERRLGASVD